MESKNRMRWKPSDSMDKKNRMRFSRKFRLEGENRVRWKPYDSMDKKNHFWHDRVKKRPDEKTSNLSLAERSRRWLSVVEATIIKIVYVKGEKWSFRLRSMTEFLAKMTFFLKTRSLRLSD